MTPGSLFSIILKILGIFFVKDIVATIPDLVSNVLFLIKSDAEGESAFTVGYTVIQLALFFYISYFLIFNTHRLIDMFKLDKGFEEEQFSFNLSATSVYIIAITVTGAFIVVTELPNLCRLIYNILESKGDSFGVRNSGISALIISVVKILIGLLLTGERKRIAELFLKNQPENVGEQKE